MKKVIWVLGLLFCAGCYTDSREQTLLDAKSKIDAEATIVEEPKSKLEFAPVVGQVAESDLLRRIDAEQSNTTLKAKVLEKPNEAANRPFKEFDLRPVDEDQLFYSKGLEELWKENFSAALAYFQKATEKNPHNAEAWSQVGYCYDQLGRYQEAMEACKQAIRITPDDAVAHYNLGVVYDQLGRYQESKEAYKQAIRIKPEHAVAHCNLGVAYGSLGRWQEAVEAHKQAIRIKPDYAGAHNNLGIAYNRLGRHQDAIEAYKQAIRIKPDYADAHNNLGIAYLLVGDKGSAFEQYKILKTLDAEMANELFNLIYK